MSDNYIRNVIEAALLAAARPLPLADLAQLFEESERPDTDTLRAALAQLATDYDGRGIEIKETASGVRVQVRTAYAGEVARLWPERPQRYSRALLETLALIAYRQPITRAEIESVRGVAVNPNILKTLMERNWVRVVGHRDVPGHPELLGTTRDFLDYFGLKALDDLPPLAELKAMADLNLQLPLPQLDAADGSGVFVSEPDGPLMLEAGQHAPVDAAAAAPPEDSLEELADDSSAGDDDSDSPTQQASGELAPGLVAAPPRDA